MHAYDNVWRSIHPSSSALFREDEFSIQFTISGRPDVFIRIEKPKSQREIKVSDFTFTERDVSVAAEMLDFATTRMKTSFSGREICIPVAHKAMTSSDDDAALDLDPLIMRLKLVLERMCLRALDYRVDRISGTTIDLVAKVD